MIVKRTSLDSIRRVLTSGFHVRDIAEPLASFEVSVPASDVRQFLEDEDYDCAGVRDHGLVVGFVCRDDLKAGRCGDALRQITEDRLVHGETQFVDVIKKLVDQPGVFVSMLGVVSGIVTRHDLTKPAIRMWLFGMLTIVEMRFVRLIQQRFPAGEWTERMSAARVEKAQQLLEERRRRQHDVELIDCLQLSDKGGIIIRDEQLRQTTGLVSRRAGERLVKRLEGLRNTLAHSQEIADSDWETIVLLSDNLDRVIEGPPGHPDLLE